MHDPLVPVIRDVDVAVLRHCDAHGLIEPKHIARRIGAVRQLMSELRNEVTVLRVLENPLVARIRDEDLTVRRERDLAGPEELRLVARWRRGTWLAPLL